MAAIVVASRRDFEVEIKRGALGFYFVPERKMLNFEIVRQGVLAIQYGKLSIGGQMFPHNYSTAAIL